MRVLGHCEPTHILGGRLDYAFLFSDPDREASLEVINSLVSDHFAILAKKKHLPKVQCNRSKKTTTTMQL